MFQRGRSTINQMQINSMGDTKSPIALVFWAAKESKNSCFPEENHLEMLDKCGFSIATVRLVYKRVRINTDHVYSKCGSSIFGRLGCWWLMCLDPYFWMLNESSLYSMILWIMLSHVSYQDVLFKDLGVYPSFCLFLKPLFQLIQSTWVQNWGQATIRFQFLVGTSCKVPIWPLVSEGLGKGPICLLNPFLYPYVWYVLVTSRSNHLLSRILNVIV